MARNYFLKFANFDWGFASLILKALSRAESITFGLLTGLKALSVFVDLLAIFLVGTWISLLSSANSGVLGTLRAHLPENITAVLANKTSLGMLTIGLFTLKGLISIFLDSRIASFVAKVESRKSSQYLKSILNRGISALDQFPKSAFSNAVLDAPASAFGQGLIAYSIILSESLLLTSISLALIFVSPFLFTCVAIIFGTIGLLSSRFVGSGISSRAKGADEARRQSATILYDIQHNARQILALSKRHAFTNAFGEANRTFAVLNAKGLVSTALPRYFVEFGLVLGVGTLVVLSSFISNSTPPNVVIGVFVAGIFRMVAALMPLQNQLNLLRKLAENSSDLDSLEKLVVPETKKLMFDRVDLVTGNPKIIAKDLSFNYGESTEAVFSNLNFEIPFGSMVSIEGESGKGKSTLADLILGLREPSNGTIGFVVDAHSNMIPASKIQLVGYVPQRVELISGSLLDNLYLEPRTVSTNVQALGSALSDSGLVDFVQTLQEGLGTRLDGQAVLSGGQIQRIGLARALLSGARVLVLDEITSALDKANEAAIIKTIEGLRGRKTIIYISHDVDLMPKPDLRISL